MSQGIQLPGDKVKMGIQVNLTQTLNSTILFVCYLLEEGGVGRLRTNG